MSTAAAPPDPIDPSTRFVEDVRVGDALPVLERDVSLTDLVIYAGATRDFHRLHYDAALAAAHGLRAPVMDGQMLGALIARLVTGWGGPDAFLCRLSYRLRQPVVVGDRIRLAGSVVATDPANALVSCEVDVLVPQGAFVVRGATAAIRLPTRFRNRSTGRPDPDRSAAQ